MEEDLILQIETVESEINLVLEEAGGDIELPLVTIAEQGPPADFFQNPKHERTRKFLGEILRQH